MTSTQQISVLGSTGSIGVNTLDVVAGNPDLFSVYALSCHQNLDLMLAQCRQHQPRFAVVADDKLSLKFSKMVVAEGLSTEVLSGDGGLLKIATDPEVNQVMAGIVGAAGLPSTLAAANAGKRVLLANKESLVMSGALFMDAVASCGAELLPIDSEHNAIFQCLPVNHDLDIATKGIDKILLTGSGGPFRTTPLNELERVTPAQACAHPNWEMGKKISVDSATMMNKGLEFIEACWLFSVPAETVEIVVHPQSIVHSMVSYVDGSVLAQMGNPDMRTPIAHAMAWPSRIDSGVSPLDFGSLASLDFEAPNEKRFPAIRLAREAFSEGGSASIVLNAANEIAVDAFLAEQLPYSRICTVVEDSLNANIDGEYTELDGILQVDNKTRNFARQLIRANRVSSAASGGEVS